MKIPEFYMPNIMCIDNEKFYIFISTLYHDLKKYKSTKVYLNCKKTKWIDPPVCAALALVLNNFKIKNNLEFNFKYLSKRHLNLFYNNGFFKSLNNKNSLNYTNPSIKLTNISTKSMIYLKNYLNVNLKSHSFYDEESFIWRDIIRCLLEIYKNADMHGNSSRLFICGHYFPEVQTLIFSLANIGETFKTNYLKKRKYTFSDDLSAIMYSLELFSTSRNENESGGIGLCFVKDILKKVDGEFIIYSGNGLYIEDSKNLKKISLDKKFPGTIVSIKIKLNSLLLYQDNIDIPDEVYNLNLKKLLNIGGEI